nr:MAG: hypothetical protein [Tombusviridae sp.]
MGTEFLSTPLATRQVVDAPVAFGTVDYADPRVVAALGGGGLKERTTFGGQIVTALKMAWWIMLLPVLLPCRLVKKVWDCLCGFVRRIVSCAVVVKDAFLDATALFREVINIRVKVLAAVLLIGACFSWGLVGLFVWLGICVGYVLCFIPTDVRFFVQLKKDMHRAWDVALEAEDLAPAEVPQPVKIKNTFACKLAVRAISRVGLLSPTKANALVYQKIILDDMRDLNVRCADRVRVLPLAVMACLHRPEEVVKVEGCIKQLFANTTGL